MNFQTELGEELGQPNWFFEPRYKKCTLSILSILKPLLQGNEKLQAFFEFHNYSFLQFSTTFKNKYALNRILLFINSFSLAKNDKKCTIVQCLKFYVELPLSCKHSNYIESSACNRLLYTQCHISPYILSLHLYEFQ